MGRPLDDPAVLHVVAGAPHGFETWASGTDLARAFVATARAWLAETLAVR